MLTDKPMFMAALTSFQPHAGETNTTALNGFAIVGAAASGDSLDLHDRMHVVLTSENANLWLDQVMLPEQT